MYVIAAAVLCVTETEEFLGDVDEDLEAMQGTVYLLQQELKDAKERLQQQQLELDQLQTKTTATNSLNSVPGVTCSEQSATVNMMTDDNSGSSVLMKHMAKMSSELMRTGGKDSTRIPDEKFVKKISHEDTGCDKQRSALDNANRIENMDVDSVETPAKCGYANDVRTSPVEHMNDDAILSEQLADDTDLHKTMVDRFRTASKVSSDELATSDCVPNGTDDDKSVAAASN